MALKLSEAFKIRRTTIYRIPELSITCFSAKMAIDADGCPTAYHPNNTGLDDLKHGRHDGNWWGVATDNEQTSGKPLIQTNEDPAPGYYVTTTSLFDAAVPYHRQSRYVNAQVIPYFVLPAEFSEAIQLGSVAWIYNTHNARHYFAIFADVGPDVGEGSMFLAEKLGVDNDPRYGGIPSGILYFIFEGSGKGPGVILSESEITQMGEAAMTNINPEELRVLFQ